jgi:hypothetical protein
VNPVRFLAVMALAALACACGTTATAPKIGGERPSYLDAVTDPVPNGQALTRRIWTPALDEGYVPQGLTAAGGHLFVSSYRPSPDLHSGRGPCRVFRIDAATGRIDGRFDLPEGLCTHSGGLEYVGQGRLLLADTRRLFLIDLERALASGRAENAMKSFALAGALRGSFATFDGRDIWIGTWTKDLARARMYRLEPRLFDEHDGGTVSDALAAESIPIPGECQGAAADPAGGFWLSASNSGWGKLYRVTRAGDVKAQYDMVPGLEDLAVDESGALWGLSESGTRKYLRWGTRFPFIFRIEVDRLR